MKKILVLILTLTISIVLIACKKNAELSKINDILGKTVSLTVNDKIEKVSYQKITKEKGIIPKKYQKMLISPTKKAIVGSHVSFDIIFTSFSELLSFEINLKTSNENITRRLTTSNIISNVYTFATDLHFRSGDTSQDEIEIVFEIDEMFKISNFKIELDYDSDLTINQKMFGKYAKYGPNDEYKVSVSSLEDSEYQTFRKIMLTQLNNEKVYISKIYFEIQFKESVFWPHKVVTIENKSNEESFNILVTINEVIERKLQISYEFTSTIPINNNVINIYLPFEENSLKIKNLKFTL